MPHATRAVSGRRAPQKHLAAKQAVKKKQKGAAKFHNEQLRTMLDDQAPMLYSLNKMSKPRETSIRSDYTPTDFVQDLTSTLQKL